MNYSVLMSLYYKEQPDYLEQAISSILNQTIPPSEIVLVCDGPLTEELDSIVNKYQANPIFKIIKLERNTGLGNALNVGLLECSNEYVLRMDTDDISIPYRAEKEIAALDSGNDIVGSDVCEFTGDPKNILGYRKVPTSHKEIVKFAKKRNPFNHPSVAFKKDKIISVGNYSPETRYMQDYYLWIRCIQNDCLCANIPESLVLMRSGVGMRARRKGKEYKKSYHLIFKHMLKTKYISFFRYLFNLFSYFLFSHLNTRFKEWFVYKFLRDKK